MPHDPQRVGKGLFLGPNRETPTPSAIRSRGADYEALSPKERDIVEGLLGLNAAEDQRSKDRVETFLRRRSKKDLTVD